MASKKAAAAALAVPEGQVLVYPTHKRQAGPLVVALPAVDGESAELLIDDDGLAIDQAVADPLIAGGEVVTEAPIDAPADA